MHRSNVLLALALVLAGCATTRTVCLPGSDGSRAPSNDPSVSHAESERTDAIDETCLFTQSWSAPIESEPRAIVVVVHGLRDHSSRYDALARTLVAHGYAVYAGDLRGHGRSGGDRQFVDSLDVFVDEVRQVIASAQAEHPEAPVFLFGHSMGGAISTLLAIAHPEYIDGLILSGAALELNPGTSTSDLGLAHFFAGVLPHAEATTLDGRSFSSDPAVRAADDADPLVIRSALPARTVSALVRAVETIRAREHEIALPLLLLHGGADRITPPGGTRRLYAEAASTDRTLHVYPEFFHDLVHEPGRAQVIDDLTGWLDARTEAR